ncbi:MAG: hypothetical protein WB609_14750, partial [Candidatus Cybelea sp.]
ILRGIARRRAVVNAVPWQTAFAALGEFSGTLADSVIVRRFTVRKTAQPEPLCHPERSAGGAESKGETPPSASLRTALRAGDKEFEEALEPVARRMERVKLSANFLREALVPGATLELNALAMRWAGMPNKNERAALREALDALEAGGLLERLQEETWRVLRAAD